MRAAKDMRVTVVKRTKRTLTALLLMFVLSFSAVFADSGLQDEGTPAEGTQNEVTAEEGSDTQDTESQVGEETPAQEPEGSIIKRGKHYFYMDPDGVIRKKAGFITIGKKLYYAGKGGRIKTRETFKVKKKYYQAGKNGVIKTGVYKWKGQYNYSYSRGQWRRRAGFVVWKGNKYYIEQGGRIITNDGFTVKNIAYIADRKGRVTKVTFSEDDDNDVIMVARKQVGKMTGRTYWTWYYRTRFVNTDRTPWCGAFVAWVYNKAGLYKKISVARRFGALGYVPSYSRYADRYKKWIKPKKARAGDIIVFGWNRHVGLVEGVYGNYIVTIEGNSGPTAAFGSGKPGAVVRKIYKLNNGVIKGVICVLKHR